MEEQAEYRTDPVMSLYVAATAAYAEQLIENEEERKRQNSEDQARKAVRLERAVRKLLGCEEGDVTPGEWKGDCLDIEGIHFFMARDRWGEEWQLVIGGKCPRCGDSTISQEIRDMADLGRNLAEFTPFYIHECRCLELEPEPEAELEPTWEENMLNLIEQGIEGRDSGEIYARPADYFLQVIAESLVRLASKAGQS